MLPERVVHGPPRRGAGLAVLAVLALVLAVPGGPARASRFASAALAAYPRCFGAASRNPAHSCSNPSLLRLVTPVPSEALLIPDAPCAPLEAPAGACTFGPPAQGAADTVALVGDSHAAHWRAALGVVAEHLHWHGVSLTRSSCPFTQAVSTAAEPKQAECVQWNGEVLSWLDAHPEASTMVISDHPGPVRTLPGQSETAALVTGIRAELQALPSSVEHVIVIRDVPYIRGDTLACVERAIELHEEAGRHCEFPRAGALHTDPDVLAAQELHSPRVQIVDLTHFFCSSRWCYPVVGGVLVYRDDFDHLTRLYSTTLGPFLLERIKELMASWG